MTSTLAEANDFTTSHISHLKICANAEHNDFARADKKAVTGRCEEGQKNRFYQLMRDRATLKKQGKVSSFWHAIC